MTGTTNGGRARGYQELHESEELHRATLGSISDAVFLTDDEGAFTYVCPNVDVIFGYVPDEVRSMSRIGALLGEDLFDPDELIAAGEIRNVEREVTSKAGERRTVLVHLKRVAIKGGTVLYTCRDISELKMAERKLSTAQLDLAHAMRLALAGQLLASIVHEVQQPLAAIHANATAGRYALDGELNAANLDSLRETLDDIRDQSSAASQIVDRLRSLVRKRELDLQPLDVNDVVGEVAHLVQGEARRRRFTLQTELAPAPPPVAADRVALQQVLLNLVVNAMDSMEDTDDQRVVTLHTRAGPATVELSVSDTGSGIPVADREKLFEAFFTTKPDGIGLGLAIARSIAEAHGGKIWAEANNGRGALFRLVLPLGTDPIKQS